MARKIKIKKGVQLWNKAKKIIPGGTQLLSKRSEMFLPDQWPSYFKKAKGVEVWDLDGNKFIDMSYMGIGACVLGYSDPDVNKAVKKVIDEGNMCTLNSPEEVELAELFLTLHPWAGGIRFARSGGEAMAIAVRIARAYTKKDKVAFCGYHGWHDWYLSANLADSRNLDGQLLPGLKPLGVPRVLKGTAIPFHYNNLNELQEIVGNNSDIGAIVMEARREHDPEKGFLEGVSKIAKQIGAVLVFDEITSGFRMNIGGIHKLYGLQPDIVVYGKAIGNGFPITVIVGRKEIMDVAQESFISSTFWTERIGPTAALATIKKIKKYNVPKHLIKLGNLVKDGWIKLAKKHNLEIEILNIPPLINFKFHYGENSQALHTLFNQEMLKQGFLVSKGIYLSWSHKREHIKKYLKAADQAFQLISKAIKNNSIKELLKGPVAHKEFRRLT